MTVQSSVRRNGRFFALAAAIAIVLFASIVGEGDPEAMALGVLAAIAVLSPFAILAPGLARSKTWQAAMAIALVAVFILFWMIGAVGLLGSDGEHPNDRLYILVPAVGLIGAVAARLQPCGMALAVLAMAAAQLLVPAIVVLAGLNSMPVSAIQLLLFSLVINGPFCALYAVSAWLFRKAARDPQFAVIGAA